MLFFLAPPTGIGRGARRALVAAGKTESFRLFCYTAFFDSLPALLYSHQQNGFIFFLHKKSKSFDSLFLAPPTGIGRGARRALVAAGKTVI